MGQDAIGQNAGDLLHPDSAAKQPAWLYDSPFATSKEAAFNKSPFASSEQIIDSSPKEKTRREAAQHAQTAQTEQPELPLYIPNAQQGLAEPERWISERRRMIYNEQKSLWDIIESAGALVTGGTASQKYAPELVDLTNITSPHIKAELKAKAVQDGCTAILSACVIEFAADHVIWPEDQKMECTLVADWLLSPAIAVVPVPWRMKFGLLLAAHTLARVADHFRQPKQHF